MVIAAYVITGAAIVAAVHFLAQPSTQTAAACYVAGLWLVFVILILRTLPAVGRDWTVDNLFRMVLWGATIAGAVTLVAVYFLWRPQVYLATVAYLLCYWLIAALYLSHETPSGEYMKALKALSTGVAFAAMAASVTYHFSPAMSVVAAVALFAIGILVGTLITFPGASFVLGLGMFSMLVTGLGYALGDIFGLKGAFVVGMFCLSLILGMMLPPLPDFQRALLSTLVTASTGIAGALLGTALGQPLAGALAFLSLGAFLSMTMGEERAISLALFSVLSSVMMALGFAAAFSTVELFQDIAASWVGGWVGGFFIFSILIYVLSNASRVRLALLLLAPVAILAGLGFGLGAAFDLGAVGWAMLVVFLISIILSVILDWYLYAASDSRVLGQNDAWVVSEQDCPRPYAITRRLAAAAGLPPPRIAVIGSDTPNLFTVGLGPSRAVIAVTQGLLYALDDDELEAVLAHELSHIGGKDLLPMTMAAALASPVGAGARSLVFDREKGSNMLMQLLVGVAAPFFALLVQLSNPRSREKRADDWAVRMTKKKEALADALEKLELAAGREPLVANPATGPLFAVNPFRSGWLVAMFSTHPSTEERVARVKKAPAAGG